MTGYHPDFDFLTALGVRLEGKDLLAGMRSEAWRATCPGIYLAGVIVAGSRTNEIFIENGRFHGRQIAADLKQKLSGCGSRSNLMAALKTEFGARVARNRSAMSILRPRTIRGQLMQGLVVFEILVLAVLSVVLVREQRKNCASRTDRRLEYQACVLAVQSEHGDRRRPNWTPASTWCMPCAMHQAFAPFRSRIFRAHTC